MKVSVDEKPVAKVGVEGAVGGAPPRRWSRARGGPPAGSSPAPAPGPPAPAPGAASQLARCFMQDKV